jgi:phosphate-selective porin OprO/OprP
MRSSAAPPLIISALAALLAAAAARTASGADEAADRLERLEREIASTRAEIDALDRATRAQAPSTSALVLWHDGFSLVVLDERAEDPGERVVHQFGLHGRIQADLRIYQDEDNPANDRFFVRRARLKATGTLWRHYDFVAECDFGQGGFAVREAYANIRFWREAQLLAGHFREPFLLENQQSVLYLDFMERHMMFRNTNVNYDFGAMLHGELADLALYQVSVQNGTGQDAIDNNDDKDVYGRIALTPLKPGGGPLEGLILGGSASYGHEDNFVPLFVTEDNDGGTINPIPASAQFLVFPTATAPGSVHGQIGGRARWNVEARVELRPVAIQTEYSEMRVEGLLAPGGLRHGLGTRGAYVDVLWMLTGEPYPWSRRVVPAHDFNPLTGGWGAWQLAARWDHLEASGEDARTLGAVGATRCNALVLGVNWYMNPLFRFQFNYVRDFFDRPAANTGRDVEDAFMVRLQVEF